MRGTLAERFWKKVQKTPGCWLWTGGLKGRGYGTIKKAGRGSPFLGAHRLSYELHFGPIPAELHVCHRCDNPGCVRPDHLFLGTAKDNSDDKFRKGRGHAGLRNPLSIPIELNGQRHCINEWSRITGIGATTIRWRLARGWSPDAILTRPVRGRDHSEAQLRDLVEIATRILSPP